MSSYLESNTTSKKHSSHNILSDHNNFNDGHSSDVIQISEGSKRTHSKDSYKLVDYKDEEYQKMEEALPEKKLKKKIRKDILELESMKKKYKKKLNEMQLEAETRAIEIDRMKNKVKEEVDDINRIN